MKEEWIAKLLNKTKLVLARCQIWQLGALMCIANSLEQQLV